MSRAEQDRGLVATFNKVADNYDEQFGRLCGIAHQVALDAVLDHAVEPESVLDIGCGTGTLLELASRVWPSARLRGVDPAERMVERARRRLPVAELQVGTAEGLALPDRSVDLALSTTSFNHWSDHRLGLREAARVVKPTGFIVVVEHAAPNLLLTAALRLTGRMVPHYSPDQFADIALAAGLRSIIVRRERGFVCLLGQPDPAAA